jgi:aminopeptidase N/puromycin-sensitive aminopeptidase
MAEILVGSMRSFCSAETRDDVQSFFAAHPVPMATVDLKHAVEQINGCITLRSLQEPNLKQWLASHSAE